MATIYDDMGNVLAQGRGTIGELLEYLPRSISLCDAVLTHADLRGCDLSELDLDAADLRDADLRGACLRHTRLVGADLRGAMIDSGIDEAIR